MASEKLFSVAGTSNLNGVIKMRFANDFAGRIKILQRNGHEDINLFELGAELTKIDCVKLLLEQNKLETEEQVAVAQAFIAKNGDAKQVKTVTVEVAAEPTERVTPDTAQAIENLVASEGDSPYTDVDIVENLSKVYGITVSRKTVGKIRKDLGIGNVDERRQQATA